MPDHSTAEQLEIAYEEWFRQDVAELQWQPSGVYPGANAKITLGDSKPRNRWSYWWRGMRSFGFFPRTSIRKFVFRCASTEESLATDCALVGADLYSAMQEYKKR